MKKKIGILTFHDANNYGAVLQCYALQSFLSKNTKHEVEIINFKNKAIENEYNLFYYCKNPIRLIKRNINNIFHANKILSRKRKFNDFRDKYLILSKELLTFNDFKKHVETLNFIIVGSDQVWNKRITKKFKSIYTLKDISNVKKISYAASCGSIDIKNDKEYRSLFEDIIKFDAITVREPSTSEYLSDYFHQNIDYVCDPTFLISRNEWERIAGTKPIIQNEYIFVYTIYWNEDIDKIVRNLKEETGYRVILCDNNFKLKGCDRDIKSLSPAEFLNIILYSKLVVASSFHGTVFSLLFNKNLISYVFKQNKNSNRITDILHLCEIEHCMVDSYETYENIWKMHRGSTSEAYSNIYSLIKKSKEFLFANLT